MSSRDPGKVTFRFANGTAVDRRMDIRVNGVVTNPGLSFTGTGSWSTWRTTTVTVPLVAGVNSVRATAVTGDGGPNVDWMKVDNADTEAAAQLLVYRRHLADPASGVLSHAYDEEGDAVWEGGVTPDPVTHTSPEA